MNILSEKKLSGKEIYNGKILNLRDDIVELPNGNTAHREVIEHNGGVCVLPLTDDNKVIMVRQLRYPFNEILLEIPAGKLELNEDPLTCGKRELSEETGCTAGTFDFLGKLYPTPAYCTEVIYMYLARNLCEKGENNLDTDEFLEIVKLPFDEVIDMVLRNEICDAKTQLAVLKTKLLIKP